MRVEWGYTAGGQAHTAMCRAAMLQTIGCASNIALNEVAVVPAVDTLNLYVAYTL